MSHQSLEPQKKQSHGGGYQRKLETETVQKCGEDRDGGSMTAGGRGEKP